MRPRHLLIALSLTGSALTCCAHAQAPANCALANLVDSSTFDALTITQWNELNQDQASYGWAECRAAKLKRDLTRYPQLSARIDQLRAYYRNLRLLEGNLAGLRNGGGTLYRHAVPRSYPWIEDQLLSLSNLARSSLGAQTGQQYARIIADVKKEHAQYLKDLRAFKPDPAIPWDATRQAEWLKNVQDYEKTGKAIMQLLGSRNDAATALGYSIVRDTLFNATGE